MPICCPMCREDLVRVAMEEVLSSPVPTAPGTNLACPRCGSILWIPIRKAGNMLFLGQPQLPMVAVGGNCAEG